RLKHPDEIAALLRGEAQPIRPRLLVPDLQSEGLQRLVAGLTVRRPNHHLLGGRGVEQLVFEGMAPLIDKRDRFAALRRRRLRQQHVVVGCRRVEYHYEPGQAQHRPNGAMHLILSSPILRAGAPRQRWSSYKFENHNTRGWSVRRSSWRRRGEQTLNGLAA